MKYACHNRRDYVAQYLSGHGQLIQNFSAGKPCEYRHTALGKRDPKCEGCARRTEAKK